MNSQVKKLTFTALMAAMITIFTAYICHIPVGQNGGYIHFGDSLIYIAACLLPWPYAMTAAAIGGGMADLLTAPIGRLQQSSSRHSYPFRLPANQIKL